MIKSIHPDDYTIRPFRVKQPRLLTDENTGSIEILHATHFTTSFIPNGTEVTNSNGLYERTVYDFLNHIYFHYNSLSEAFGVFVGENISRSLHESARLLTIAQDYVGEGIVPSTFLLTDLSTSVSLSDDGNGNLVNLGLSGSDVDYIAGNIFYKHGILTITNTGSAYDSIITGTGSDGYNLNFDVYHTIYEHEVTCRIREDEFNYSTNPSTMVSGSSDGTYQQFVTGSYFAPYVTTIGLLDDNLDLVAVAKLTEPLKNESDVEYLIKVRFDM